MFAKTLGLSLAMCFFLTLDARAQEHDHDHDHDHDHVHWIADFDEAVKVAKEKKKDLFVDFTGSDWCGWCMKLDEEVFSKEHFIKEAPKHFVLVKLDYPRGPEAKAKVPNPQRNGELQQKYGIRGFPTVLLMTADGVVYGRMGYQKGGPKPYVEAMNKSRVEGKAALAKAEELVKKHAGAEGDERKKITEELLAVAKGLEGDSPAVAILAPVLLAELKAKTLTGEKEVELISALVEMQKVDDDVIAAAKRVDPKNETGVMDRIRGMSFGGVGSIEGVNKALTLLDSMWGVPFKDKDLEKFCLANAAHWCSHEQILNDMKRAQKYAKRLKPLVGEDDVRLQALVEKVLGGDSEEEGEGGGQ